MRSLISFELKKIIGRRMTVFALIGALLLSLLFFALTVLDERHISYNSRDSRTIQSLHGLEAIEFDREVMRELKGYLTKEYIDKREVERAIIEENPDNLEKISAHDLKIRENEMRSAGFLETDIANIPMMILKDDVYIREIDKYDFLRSHVGLIERIPRIISELKNGHLDGINENRPGQFLNKGRPFGAGSETSKLLQMYQQVDMPYYYDYYFGWERLSRSLSGLVAFILSAVIVICLSPVFSQEYSSHTAPIMLATKYGKNKLIVAKLISAFIFTTAVFLLLVAINFGLFAVVYGLTGYNSHIQLELLYFQSPYNLTFLELNLFVLGLSYIGLIFIAAITLFISAKVKNPFICVILSALVLYIPMIDLSRISYLAHKIMSLFPINMMNANENFELGVLYHLFGVHLLQPIMMITVAILLSISLGTYAYKSFKNHQV